MSRIVIVTGMSGAGRTSCLKILEDCGFEAVDNLPFQLLERILRPGEEPERPLAVGLDSRTRGFDPAELVRRVGRFREESAVPITVLFFECDDETLRRRYTETRRRHPLAQDRPVGDGILRERELLAPVKAAADRIYDTSASQIADLRRRLTAELAEDGGTGLTVSIVSFAFRNGLPREADIVLDVRFLRNPHYVDELRPLTGLDPGVQAHIRADPDLAGFLARALALLEPLLPRYRAEGKSYLTIALGCTGGKHRSVYVAEEIAGRLRQQGWQTATIHRDMPRDGSG